jgi:hypothetical protein
MKFGPNPNNPTILFEVSTQFQLTNQCKTFACQDGLMIIQQSSVNPALVNVILKPKEELKIPFGQIKYFVYRGLSKDSFISGTNITPQATGNSEFIARFWVDWNQYKISHPTLPNPGPESFGYDNSLSSSLDIEKIYDNSQVNNIRPIYVKEGEWIGNFGTSSPISFEVVVDTNNIFNLDFLRADMHQIDVTSLWGLDIRAKREQILSFIDPAAFFGLHYDEGVSVSTYTGTVKTTENKKQNDLYISLISKFTNKNCVYLDIRSEKGYSYNFYQNYGNASGKNIKVGSSVVTPAEETYEWYSCPLIMINSPLSTTEDKNNIKINLRIDDNTKPILFCEDTTVLANNQSDPFIKETNILNGTTIDWSKDLDFVFPNTGTSASKDSVAYYIRLYYFRQEYNPASPDTVLKNEKYFDSAFCPIDLPNLGNEEQVLKCVFNPNRNYINGTLPTGEDFGYLANNGAYWNENRIVFFSRAVFSTNISRQSIPLVPKFAIDPGLSIVKESFLNKDISIVNNKLDENGVGYVNLLEFIHSNSITAFKENIILLCFSLSEFNILTQSTGLSGNHSKYIYIEELTGSPFTDSKGVSFRKFALKLQGIDNNGFQKIVSPATPIYIYSKDGFLFNSKNYGDLESINNKKKISNIYGGIRVYEWIGYIDDSREANVVQLLENTCEIIPSLFPSLLYTIAIGEGLNLWIDNNYSPTPPHNVMINNRINGFDYLGTDDFGSDFARYRPFLPNTYNEGDEFVPYNAINEHNNPVISADFKNLESGLLGIGAVIAHRKNKFLSDALELNYDNEPNIDQIIFWTYVYFQGEGRAKKYLQNNNDFDFSKNTQNMTQIRRLALERLATWRYIKTSNILSK